MLFNRLPLCTTNGRKTNAITQTISRTNYDVGRARSTSRTTNYQMFPEKSRGTDNGAPWGENLLDGALFAMVGRTRPLTREARLLPGAAEEARNKLVKRFPSKKGDPKPTGALRDLLKLTVVLGRRATVGVRTAMAPLRGRRCICRRTPFDTHG